jgi:hypothetical protein
MARPEISSIGAEIWIDPVSLTLGVTCISSASLASRLFSAASMLSDSPYRTTVSESATRDESAIRRAVWMESIWWSESATHFSNRAREYNFGGWLQSMNAAARRSKTANDCFMIPGESPFVRKFLISSWRGNTTMYSPRVFGNKIKLSSAFDNILRLLTFKSKGGDDNQPQ